MSEGEDEQFWLGFDARMALDGPVWLRDGTPKLGSEESYGRSSILRSMRDCDTVLRRWTCRALVRGAGNEYCVPGIPQPRRGFSCEAHPQRSRSFPCIPPPCPAWRSSQFTGAQGALATREGRARRAATAVATRAPA